MIKLLFPNPTLSSILSSIRQYSHSITSIDLVIEILDQRLEDVPLPPNEIYRAITTNSENQVTVLLTDRIGNEWGTLGMVGSILVLLYLTTRALY